jgi:4-amino-4-deoxy-L-arabinose transferase-like glycosyltransferase
MPQHRHLQALLIWFVALALFVLGLWQQEFIAFESRFGVFAQEMLRNGISLFPTTYGEPYPDYPSTGTLLICLFSLPFGEVTKLSAILPSALAAATTVALTWLLAVRLSPRWALLAIGFELITYTFVFEARTISLDQIVAALTIGAFYLAYTADQDNKPSRCHYILLLLFFGFCVRGPIGVVIPTGVVCSYYLLDGQWRRMIVFGCSALVVLALSSALLLGLAYLQGGREFIDSVISMQITHRMDKEGDGLPLYWYLTNNFGNYALTYPIAMLVIAASLPMLLRRQWDERQYFLLLMVGWLAVVIAGMSVPQGKKERYLLPMVPALALIAAYPLVALQQTRTIDMLRHIIEKTLMLLPLLGIIGILVGQHYLNRSGQTLSLPLVPVLLALIAIQLAIVLWFKRQPLRNRRELGIMLWAVAAFWLCNVAVFEQAYLQLYASKPFVDRVEQLRRDSVAPLGFYGVAKDNTAIKYLVNADYDLHPLFLLTIDEVQAHREPLYLLVKDEYNDEVQQTLGDRIEAVETGRLRNRAITAYRYNFPSPP